MLAAAAWGCASPVGPSGSSVAGAWVANSTLDSVSGGECVGVTLQGAIGSRDIFLTAVNQKGSTLEATVSSPVNGTSCAYDGRLDGGSVRLTKNACRTDRITGVRCGDGQTRDLQLSTGTMAVSVSAQVSGQGTDTSTWNIFVPGASVPIAALTVVQRFTWVFLGLPSSDYHVFTGTVFPGYADGTIVIEGADVFCQPCGWFPH